MASAEAEPPLQALIAYEDDYVNPLILSALATVLPPQSYTLTSALPADPHHQPYLHYTAYETLDFPRALAAAPGTCLVNAYVIRKALIRKHFLAQIVESHVTKHPGSPLARHWTPAAAFELDYAEFLDDALVEAFELRAALERNAARPPAEREWWILKPGMSDRGQGIRLFSTEEELKGIFERWEEENPSDEEDGDDGDEDGEGERGAVLGEGIMTSQLRHFVAQPYIHPPLLLAQEPFSKRKFHIRTYVVAHGALKVYVYGHMLALFASEAYVPPWDSAAVDGEDGSEEHREALLEKMRNVHLTNTCVQTADGRGVAPNAPSPVHLLSDLPLPEKILANIQDQIHVATGDLFKAGLAYPTHFQPLPNSFEVFGLDFLVAGDAVGGTGDAVVQLLEVNAFPDFQQTGDKLRDVVVKGLLEQIAREVIAPHFNIAAASRTDKEFGILKKVLDVDMGRR